VYPCLAVLPNGNGVVYIIELTLRRTRLVLRCVIPQTHTLDWVDIDATNNKGLY